MPNCGVASDSQTYAPSKPDKPVDLRIRTKEFALRIVNLYRNLPHTEEAKVIGKQVLRSGTSVGANYRAACRSRSKAEFISKISIVLEEADETVFWLELLLQAEIFPHSKIEGLLAEANELTSIFVTSLRTSKGLTSAF
jgi:four helix bundle protein